MSKELEIEFKNMLTKTEFTTLIEGFFSQADSFTQTNFYFDTPTSDLKKQLMGLRLRQREDHNECTLKVPTSHEHSHYEITDQLTSKEMDRCLNDKQIPLTGEVPSYLKSINITPETLIQIGGFTTCRREVRTSPDVLWVLDQSTFGTVVDYELELEVSDSVDGETIFQTFLNTHQITEKPALKKMVRMHRYQAD